MTEPIWAEFEGSIPRDATCLPGYLEMHGPVNAVRVTYYPGIALPHIELWTERPAHPEHDPDGPPAYSYFNAFAPVRQDQTDEQWLALLLSGDSTTLQPVPPTTEEESTPE